MDQHPPLSPSPQPILMKKAMSAGNPRQARRAHFAGEDKGLPFSTTQVATARAVAPMGRASWI